MLPPESITHMKEFWLASGNICSESPLGFVIVQCSKVNIWIIYKVQIRGCYLYNVIYVTQETLPLQERFFFTFWNTIIKLIYFVLIIKKWIYNFNYKQFVIFVISSPMLATSIYERTITIVAEKIHFGGEIVLLISSDKNNCIQQAV